MLKKTDLGVGLYLLCAVLFFIIPIPSFLLDVMLAFNLSIALIILFKVLFVKKKCLICHFSRHYYCLRLYSGFHLMSHLPGLFYQPETRVWL